MRVLYFHQHFVTPSGAGGIRSYQFARALIARGHHVTMICGSHTSEKLDVPWDHDLNAYHGIIDGIEVITFPLGYSNRAGLLRRTWIFVKFAFYGARFALSADYDILFATSTPLTAAVPGIVAKLFLRRKPFVFEVRDLWPELPRALGLSNPLAIGGMSMLEWLAYRCSDLCVGLAPGIADGIRRRSPKHRRIELIPNGADLQLFNPSLREKGGVPGSRPGEFIAGFIGTHGVANGLDAVLDAAAALLHRGRHNIRIVLIGDGKEKDRLVARARSECLTNVSFIDPMAKTSVSRVTASFDCGLMILANVPAFYYGTSPNKFFDYISAGVPVVCNYPGWLADLIRDHKCGQVTAPGDPSALADALCMMADAPDSRAEMGRYARRLAETMFDRATLAAQFVGMLEGIAGRAVQIGSMKDTHPI